MINLYLCFFLFKQKTAYDMRISDWSSDVCSSDLTCIDSLDHGTNNDHRDHRSYAARCGNKASEHDRIAHQPFQHRRKKRQHRKNQYAKKKYQQGSKKELAILEIGRQYGRERVFQHV